MQSFHKKVQKRKNNNSESTLVERQHWNVSASPHQKNPTWYTTRSSNHMTQLSLNMSSSMRPIF